MPLLADFSDDFLQRYLSLWTQFIETLQSHQDFSQLPYSANLMNEARRWVLKIKYVLQKRQLIRSIDSYNNIYTRPGFNYLGNDLYIDNEIKITDLNTLPEEINNIRQSMSGLHLFCLGGETSWINIGGSVLILLGLFLEGLAFFRNFNPGIIVGLIVLFVGLLVLTYGLHRNYQNRKNAEGLLQQIKNQHASLIEVIQRIRESEELFALESKQGQASRQRNLPSRLNQLLDLEETVITINAGNDQPSASAEFASR